MEKDLSKRRINRMNIISVIYRFELFKEKVNSKIAFEEFDLDQRQIQTLEFIERNYDFFKSNITKFIRTDWTWETIAPLIRSILVLGAFELMYLDARVIVNEMVEITKDYSLDNESDFKFVNAILDKVNREYELKKAKKTV